MLPPRRMFQPPARLALIAAIILVSSPFARAAVITNLTDTATTFSGSFSLSGVESVIVSTSNFPLMPNGNPGLDIRRTATNSSVRTASAGQLDDPAFAHSNTSAFGPLSLSGSYFNGGAFADVTGYFLFYDLADSGPNAATFTGSFIFSSTPITVPPTGVPDSGSTVLMLALGLLGIAAWRRRRDE